MGDCGEYLRLVMAGVTIQTIATHTSPWFNLFIMVELLPFSETEARELVVSPVAGHYTYQLEALQLLLQASDLKPQEIQRLASLSLETMLRRVLSTVQAAGRQVQPEDACVQPEDVCQAITLAGTEKAREYEILWSSLLPAQQQALLSLIQTDENVPSTKVMLSPERLAPVLCRDGRYIRLTFLFKEWLKGR